MTLREALHLDAVAGLDADTPVVMLNLMKFRERSLDGNGSGWDAYRRENGTERHLILALHSGYSRLPVPTI